MTGITNEKGIDYFIEHPEAVDPNDHETIAALIALDGREPVLIDPNSAPAKPAEEAKPAEAKPAEPAKPAAEAKPAEVAKPAEPEAKGVLAADGKGIIPYGVLAEERRNNQQLRTALDEMTGTLHTLTKQVEALESGKDGKGVDAGAVDRIAEGIAKVREEAPWLADTLNEMQTRFTDTVDKLQGKITELTKDRADEAKDVETEIVREVTSTIDQVPLLAHFKASNAAAFTLAVGFDDALKQNPEWADKSMKDRFEHVAKMVVEALGQDVVPLELRSKPAEAAPIVPAKPGLSEADLIKAAAVKVKDTGPVTLTDLPGGAMPAQTEDQALADISITDLAAKFERMTPEQQSTYMSGFR